jgi:glycosyltransferase involved in cell wall biosynthesis
MLVFISDFDMRGSGYMMITSSICKELANRGYDIKVIGVGYNREEHNFPFSIIPMPLQNSLQVSSVAMSNLLSPALDLDIEAIIVPLDIPMQEPFLTVNRRDVPYMGIFPLESPPLCRTWASLLNQMDSRFVISEFGNEAVNEAGVESKFLPVGIDFESWKRPSADDRKKIRATMGFEDDEFVVITVADNQERKNLGSAFEMIAGLRKKLPKIKWLLVSRINFKFGWFVYDLAMDLDITDVIMPFEKGIEFKKLWALYSASDAFLLTSKAEGLGMPMLEAMAMGVPIVATDHTAMRDHMLDGRGFPIEPYAWFIDPFGNSRRCYPSVESGIDQLHRVATMDRDELNSMVGKAMDYAVSRTWPKTVDLIEGELARLRLLKQQYGSEAEKEIMRVASKIAVL